MPPTSYSTILQHRLRLADQEWSYFLTDLPNSDVTDKAGLVKSCHLVANNTVQHLTLSFAAIPSNRAISEKPLNCLLHFTCSDFRLHHEDGKPATFRESTDYLARLLKHGIHLNGQRYSFYGHSNSQLKSRSCFLMAGTQDHVDEQVEALGNFTMATVAKKVKRIGLLFSTAHAVVDVDPSRCRDIPDIVRDSYIFTDGCGNISPAMANLLTRRKPIMFRNKGYHPSVFQIRYRSYKGVVLLKPKLGPHYWLELRASMKKFSGSQNLNFAVVEYSKPFTYGYLNDEVILLLHALGVPTSTFQRKQHDHFSLLDHATEIPVPAFRFLNSVGESQLAEKLLLEGIESCEKSLRKLIAREKAKMINKRNLHKSRILILKSRLVFGVCDTRGVLEEDECFFKPTMDEDGIAHAITGSYVLVARNPCLHPGDLQKLRVVARPELAHLVDCIVFSVKGRRPAADMMSGGDLDGDTFFVCWDPELIPVDIAQPADYPGPKESIQFTRITTADRIDYFARSSNMQLGQIKNLYLQWARYSGPLSSQCQELNRLFSQCVDASRITIPDRLKDVPAPPTGSEFILDLLHVDAAERVRKLKEPISMAEFDSVDQLLSLLAEPTGYTQFELARMTLQWCQMHHIAFEEFWYLFDSTLLSSDEKSWLIAHLPSHRDIPEAIQNDLLQSDLLSPQELSNLGLRGVRIRWKLAYSSDRDRISNLLDVFYRTFPIVTRKMLILRIHERLSVALYIPQTVQAEEESPLGPYTRLFAIPHDRDDLTRGRIMVPTKHNSRLYYDHGGFQLYEGKRANTFIFLAHAANDTGRYRNVRGRGQRARLRQETIEEGVNHEWRTSVALNKFSQSLATHVGRLWREGVTAAELFIVSNTDQRSWRNLDLWLEQVDTDRVIHNFAVEMDPTIPISTPHDIDLNDETSAVRQMLKDARFRDFIQFTANDLGRALELAWQNNSHITVNQIFSEVVLYLTTSSINNTDFVTVLVEFLDPVPTMVVHLVRSDLWTQLETSGLETHHWLFAALQALILCANRMEQLATGHFGTLLARLRKLSIAELQNLVELVTLTVSTPEIALDLLIERLEFSTARLMVLPPKISHYLVTQLSAIGIDHIEEAVDAAKQSQTSGYQWRFSHAITKSDGMSILVCDYRVDAPVKMRLAVGDHLRFVCTQCPESMLISQISAFEVLVERFEVGRLTMKCFRHPPAIYQRCLWRLEHCGSFVTAQTTMDAVVKLIVERHESCKIYEYLTANNTQDRIIQANPVIDLNHLNASQRYAVVESMQHPVSSIWGPPGTGKTQTIVAIISEILASHPDKRLLVTAPTHNAVDNVLRRYLSGNSTHSFVRVSTDVRKVSPDLRAHTCDAMLGKDLNQNPAGRRKAQQRISQARLVFTTCIGAGLGLLRTEAFDSVIIDEASQQTEPASLVPIVKGCSQLILVGDHIQLRATVRPYAATLGFDVSLFESLWTGDNGIGKFMLDTQYRMHPEICKFPSNEFYQGRLKSAAHCEKIALPQTAFIWPSNHRLIFVQCSTAEDLGRRSKSNSGQAKVCQTVLSQIRETSTNEELSVAVLTPYTRQVEQLQQMLPSETISSIDGFQGQEADIIVYVSVRCNVHGTIGFLKDMRRLNVALTRARAGIVIIGDESTLTGKAKNDDEEEQVYHSVWKRLIDHCRKVDITVHG